MGNELAQSGQARFELGHALRQVAEDTLSQTDTWLADVSRVLADPKAVLRERGLSTTGEVELDLTLSFRPSPTL